MTLQLNPVWTLVAALLAIQFGKRINAKIVWLERGNIPPAVTAGLFFSLILAILRGNGWLDVRFHTGPRDVLLLVFFASLGFGAHLRQLASAGKGALVICAGVAADANFQGAGQSRRVRRVRPRHDGTVASRKSCTTQKETQRRDFAKYIGHY